MGKGLTKFYCMWDESSGTGIKAHIVHLFRFKRC